MSTVAAVLLAVHDALEAAGIPHAVGGALALAYCIEEPRATRDIDLNVFLAPERAPDVLAALPPEVERGPAEVELIRWHGQARLWWADVPLDLFFDVHEFHAETAAEVREVPFFDRTIPVISCRSLVVFKCLYGRTRDWADIEAVLEARAIDCADTLAGVRRLLGEEHASALRLAALCHAG